MTSHVGTRAALPATLAAVMTACSLLTSLDGLTGLDASTEAAVEAATDAVGDETDAHADASTFHDMTSLESWSAFDLVALGAAPAGFWGGALDGRYLYMTPFAFASSASVVYRYDTKALFTASASWDRFDTTTAGSGAFDFAGTAFDGRYLHLAPAYGSMAYARYDTQAPFAQPSSWTVTASPYTSREGAAFDGRYVYFVPSGGTTVAQYDTVKATWAGFDVATADAGVASGFTGAVFDGRWVYFFPPSGLFEGNPTGSVVFRYDTQGSFTAAPSWSSFDTQAVSPAAAGYFGGAFDGRWLYLVPFGNSQGADGVVVRYDTTAAFGAPSSWETFDAATFGTQARGFGGAAFDGRFVYFVPQGAGSAGLVVRYDTLATFKLAASWQSFDTHGVNVGAAGFLGAVFDGEYVYFMPRAGHVVARFDARSPPGAPKPASGSFF